MGRGKYILKLAGAITGIIIGVGAGIAFGFGLKNPDAGAFGFLSGAVAAIALLVHITYRRKYWTYEEHASLIRLMYTGCFIQLIGVVGFVLYLVLGCINQTDHLQIQGRSYFLTCVWCFMTWKWGFFLFLHSRHYRRELTKRDEYTSIQDAFVVG